MDIKAEIRRQVIGRRDAVVAEERVAKSALIGKRLMEYLIEVLTASNEDSDSRIMDCRANGEACPLGHPDGQDAFDSLASASQALAGKTIAVYQAMKSEPSLDTFICKAYQADARICFPCMTKHLETDMSYDPTRQTMSANEEARWPDANCSEEVGKHEMSCYMAFRMAERTCHETGTIPFAANPLKGYRHDDPLICDFPTVQATDIDIVIVPMVAFDNSLNRLGYGGGNYDRFLPQLREDAIVVGVAFIEQEIERVPTDEHDYPLPHIITA